MDMAPDEAAELKCHLNFDSVSFVAVVEDPTPRTFNMKFEPISPEPAILSIHRVSDVQAVSRSR